MSKPWPDCLNLVKHAQLIKVGNPCLWRVNCFLGSKRLRRTDLTMTNTSNDLSVYVSQNTTHESFSKLFSNVKSNPLYPCWSDGWALVGFDVLEPLSTRPSIQRYHLGSICYRQRHHLLVAVPLAGLIGSQMCSCLGTCFAPLSAAPSAACLAAPLAAPSAARMAVPLADWLGS